MTAVTVRELWSYPIKGCQGVQVEELQVTKNGVIGDRRFAVWSNGRLVDQKLTPRMATIAAALDPAGAVMTLDHSELGKFSHDVRHEGKSLKGTWVLDEFEAIDQGDDVAAWLSKALGEEVRLIKASQPWEINFPVPDMERLHGKPKERFTAASEVSLANQASLDELNKHLDTPVTMDRFRMNVIVDGLAPYAEDHMETASNGNVEILQVTPAERCIIVTTDQKSGERPENNLMEMLGKHRRKKTKKFGSGLLFGNYMTVSKEGTIRVGDQLDIVNASENSAQTVETSA